MTTTQGINTGLTADPACDGTSPGGAMFFTGVTSQHVLQVNEVMHVSGTVTLGADPAPAPAAGQPMPSVSNLSMNICTQLVGSTIASDAEFVGDVTAQPIPKPLMLAAGSSVPFTLSKSFKVCPTQQQVAGCIAPGTYNVGLCGCILAPLGVTPDPWVVDESWLTVQVSQ